MRIAQQRTANRSETLIEAGAQHRVINVAHHQEWRSRRRLQYSTGVTELTQALLLRHRVHYNLMPTRLHLTDWHLGCRKTVPVSHRLGHGITHPNLNLNSGEGQNYMAPKICIHDPQVVQGTIAIFGKLWRFDDPQMNPGHALRHPTAVHNQLDAAQCAVLHPC